MFHAFKPPEKSSIAQSDNQGSYRAYIKSKVEGLELVYAALGDFDQAKTYNFNAVSNKLNFCRFLAEAESSKSAEELDEQLPVLSSLISEFQHLVDNIYLNPVTCSYRLLGTLEEAKSQATANTAQSDRLHLAIKICEHKIVFLSAQIKMLQLQISDLLGIKWFDYTATLHLKSERNKLQHFSTFSFKYEDAKFGLEIDQNGVAEPIAPGQQKEFEQLIEDLITVCAENLSLDENRGTVFDRMFIILIKRARHDLEKSKFNFADFFLALQKITQDIEIKDLLSRYNDITEELYHGKTIPSYELLNDLNQKLKDAQRVSDNKQTIKFKTAVTFCENRIKLLNVQLDLIRIKIMRKLQLNWRPTIPETQLCATEQLLLDYDRFMICYAGDQFTVAIKSYYSRAFVESSATPPPEELLRGLIYLADNISRADHNILIDLIARRWARLPMPGV